MAWGLAAVPIVQANQKETRLASWRVPSAKQLYARRYRCAGLHESFDAGVTRYLSALAVVSSYNSSRILWL
jgi:hypothetical protein